MTSPLVILYEDSDCLAVAKPAGQFTQGTWAPQGEMTLEGSLRLYIDPANPASVYLGIVHRLDRPTSGVLLWAKTPKAARRLSSQFQRRRAVKEYWAIVELASAESESVSSGQLGASDAPDRPGNEDSWVDWLTRPSDTGIAQIVPPGTPGARQAVTRVRRAVPIALQPSCAWLRLWPQTGRTHQLRAQASARGMPIVGDRAYGSASTFGEPQSIALHARSLHVRHPILGTPMDLVAPLPNEWRRFGAWEV